MTDTEKMYWSIEAIRITLMSKKDSFENTEKDQWVANFENKKIFAINFPDENNQRIDILTYQYQNDLIQVNITTKKNRVDWVFQIENPKLVDVSQVREYIDSFLEVIEPIIKAYFKLNTIRVAINVDLIHPTSDLISSTRVLKKFASFINIDDNQFDEVNLRLSKRIKLDDFNDLIVNKTVFLENTKKIKLNVTEGLIPEGKISDAFSLRIDMNSLANNKDELENVEGLLNSLKNQGIKVIESGI